ASWARRTLSASCADDWAVHDARASAAARTLADIAGSVGVEHRAGHARRRVERAERGHRGDLFRRGDATEGDVGEQARTAAAGEIVLGHPGIGEPRRYREAEDTSCRIGPGDRLVQREQAALRGRVVPVLGRIAAVTG